MNASARAVDVLVEKIGTQARLEGLDSLRGLAALAVVVLHVYGIHKLEVPPRFAAIVVYLALGVPLFFVLSAFSLMCSTLPRVGQQDWLRAFATRRFLRIAPLF